MLDFKIELGISTSGGAGSSAAGAVISSAWTSLSFLDSSLSSMGSWACAALSISGSPEVVSSNFCSSACQKVSSKNAV